jgi:hypothetical protein
VTSATHWQHECVVRLLLHPRLAFADRAIREPDVRGFRLDIVPATDAWKLANERQVLLVAFARGLVSHRTCPHRDPLRIFDMHPLDTPNSLTRAFKSAGAALIALTSSSDSVVFPFRAPLLSVPCRNLSAWFSTGVAQRKWFGLTQDGTPHECAASCFGVGGSPCAKMHIHRDARF